MTNTQIQNAAYVAAMKTKKPKENGQVIVCTDKEKGQYGFESIRDMPFKQGLTLDEYLTAQFAAQSAKLTKKISTLTETINKQTETINAQNKIIKQLQTEVEI